MILPLNENVNNRVVWGQMKEKPWAEHLVPVYVILGEIRIEIKLLLKIRARVNVIWIKGLTLSHFLTGHSPVQRTFYMLTIRSLLLLRSA